jgi:hypothetical protein
MRVKYFSVYLQKFRMFGQKMKRLELKPHAGIGPIRFGANREEIRLEMARIGMPLDSNEESKDFFGNYRAQVEYEDDNTASFIGVNNDPELALAFEGFDLFDMDAKDAFTLVVSRDGTGKHEFSSFECILPGQIVAFYEAAPQYDHWQGGTRPIWGQIGCGDQRYLDAILKIQNGVLNPQAPRSQ